VIRNITALLVLCSFYATSALAVNSPAIENDFGAWLAVSVRLPVYKKYRPTLKCNRAGSETMFDLYPHA